MNSFRIARAALRARPAAVRVPLQRRTYAEAVPDKARPETPDPATVFNEPDPADRYRRSS